MVTAKTGRQFVSALACFGIITIFFHLGLRSTIAGFPRVGSLGDLLSSSVNVSGRRRLDIAVIPLRRTDTHGRETMQYRDGESVNAEAKSVLPTVFVVTPTYTRPLQKAEMTHMCNVLRHVKNVFWIVIEDSLNRTDLVKTLISNCKIPSVHMNVKSLRNPERTIPQRNLALDWLRVKVNVSREPGVLYFADDDNTYDARIFDEMRYTRKISVWPVGLAGGALVETALVENGTVVDWLAHWHGNRKFPVDMAGFAVNVKLLLDFPNAYFDYNMIDGFMESQFIERFNVTLEDLEPKANNCTEVLVWHTQRNKPSEFTQGTPGKRTNRKLPKYEV